jgi:transglutaminase-like putative cysteine protease
MKLAIQHTTLYRYEAPVNYTIQYLRLTPRSSASQRVLRWRVETPGDAIDMTDAFGNLMHVLVVDAPHQEIAIRVTGEVETTDTAGIVGNETEALPPGVFLRPSHLTAGGDAVQDLVAPLGKAIEKDRLEGLHRLLGKVSDAVSYRQGETDAATTAADALHKGSGVCQDQAHVFVAAARALGVPARYVSGYLHVGRGASDNASHAWAEAWVEDLGWVGFDITNGISPTDQHLRLAVGLDYLSCAPVRGVRRGGGAEALDVSVQVAQGSLAGPTNASFPPDGAQAQ